MKHYRIYAWILAALVAMPLAAQADENPAGITVQGVGSAKAMPSVVEISATVHGEAEMANDASVKYRDTRKKATTAIESLKNPSLSIESKGFTINQAMDPNAQMRMMQGMASEGGKQKVSVTEQLRLVIKDADKLELDKLMETTLKLIDFARDNGLQIGPGQMNYYQMQIAMQSGSGTSMIAFKIPDASALRQKAYKLAIDDAKEKAGQLAELSGVKLGRIISVQSADGSGNSNDPTAYYYRMMGQSNASDDAGLSTNVFAEIPLVVRLSVQFEIVK